MEPYNRNTSKSFVVWQFSYSRLIRNTLAISQDLCDLNMCLLEFEFKLIYKQSYLIFQYCADCLSNEHCYSLKVLDWLVRWITFLFLRVAAASVISSKAGLSHLL